MADAPRTAKSRQVSRFLRGAGVGVATAGIIALGGCATPPTRTSSASGRYYDSKLGVFASPRLVADGEAVPRGGGTYLVGRPYTIGGRAYYPSERPDGYTAVGMASWYGDAFHGRRTANGEIFDKNSITAAHPTLPLPSYVRATNTGNGRSMIVRVNDRGPYHGGRVMDVSQRVAEALNFKVAGTARIKVEYVGRAGLKGSDDEKLLATLRIDGGPASLDGSPAEERMLASDDPPAAPEPLAPPREALAQVERLPRPEGDPFMEPVPDPPQPRQRYGSPVPPRRPYDVSDRNGFLPPARTAEVPQPLVARVGSRSRVPPLVSFAPSESAAGAASSIVAQRRPLSTSQASPSDD